jgi:hypothetical protein
VETAFYNTLLKKKKKEKLTGRQGRRCKQLLDDFNERRE